MVADAGREGFSLLRVDGGASRNDVLMQLQADAIQVLFLSTTTHTKLKLRDLCEVSRMLHALINPVGQPFHLTWRFAFNFGLIIENAPSKGLFSWNFAACFPGHLSLTSPVV